ncbi:hypothetical protein [Hymenobacter cellulosilyticus]|uniref:Uncharacterized protein n=1 Tax=Hymenobacter cellulosilyticus TaxID=2932248 RepID=A0A8T9Q0D5_9BACT|nr:hypothetical protein [Hymenobacter cellulosilyticus]UOQ70894.1 hypothetical protein MUN79_19725 [Hymenobacter cellulosilyticus]
MATYEHLFKAAAQLPPPSFAFDLTASVLAQLPQAQPRRPAFPWALSLVAFLVAVVVIVFLAVFGGALVQAFRSSSTELGAVLVAGAGLLAAGQALTMLARHRRQMSQLTFS